MAKYKQMTLEDRITIERGLDNHQSFKAIASSIDKDCTTISKEVRSHLVFKKSGAYGRSFNNCVNRTHCHYYGICDKCSFGHGSRDHRCASCGRCTDTCLDFKEEICSKLLKPPYVCNGCESRRFCTLEKRTYNAESAQDEYTTVLSESRLGAAVSDGDVSRLDAIISPLLIKGQSLHHIYLNHRDELMVSERTLYKYVDAGLFKARNIDMPRTIRMSPRRKKPDTIKIDTKCREGRTRRDYEAFIRQNPDTPVVQLDSVEGIKNGAVLLTVTFVSTGLQLAFRRDHNDARSVSDIFDKLYLDLRPDIFITLFPVCLADNGSEFSDPKRIEFDANGNRRSRVFYCDSSAPYQKGSCEVRHEMIRRIIPKHTDITPYSQEKISLMMSHINSYKRKTFGDKSPYEVFAFQYGEETLKKLGLTLIPTDEICLNPSLLK